MWRGGSVTAAPRRPCSRAQASNPRPRRLEMRGEPRGLPDLELVPLPDEHRLLFEAERRLHPVVEHHPPLRIHAQDLARSEQRGGEGVARRRERRQRGQAAQSISARSCWPPQSSAGCIERGIGVDALESVLRQRLTEGGRNRDPALGVEAVGEMREEAVHEAPRRQKPAASGERSSTAAARKRGLLTGWLGITWDPMGVKQTAGDSRPRNRPCSH